jgi:hypothetical protein
MASATKEYPLWDEAVEDARRRLAEMPEPHRTAFSEEVEWFIDYRGERMTEEDQRSAASKLACKNPAESRRAGGRLRRLSILLG